MTGVIGFVTTGVPLGVAFSFLISAPMVNEVALVLLFGLFGWRIAALYLVTGLAIAIVAGWVIGRFHLEGWVEPWVYRVQAGTMSASEERRTWADRVRLGRDAVNIVGKVWPYVLGGIAVGAAIHGYVPQDFMASFMGKGAWWSVSLAVLIGIPLYSNAAGIIPVVQALLGKGAALGTNGPHPEGLVPPGHPDPLFSRRRVRRILRSLLTPLGSSFCARGKLLGGRVCNVLGIRETNQRVATSNQVA